MDSEGRKGGDKKKVKKDQCFSDSGEESGFLVSAMSQSSTSTVWNTSCLETVAVPKCYKVFASCIIILWNYAMSGNQSKENRGKADTVTNHL